MSLKLQLIVAIADLLAMLYISNLVRTRKVELKYILIWYLVGILLLIFDLVPGVLGGLTKLLSIELPVNMLFFLGFVFVLMIVFSQTVVISNLTRRNKKLIQELGLANKRIDDISEKLEDFIDQKSEK